MAKKRSESKSGFDKKMEHLLFLKNDLEKKLSNYHRMSNPSDDMIAMIQNKIFEIEEEMYNASELEYAKSWNTDSMIIGEEIPEPPTPGDDQDEKELRRRNRRRRRGFN